MLNLIVVLVLLAEIIGVVLAVWFGLRTIDARVRPRGRR